MGIFVNHGQQMTSGKKLRTIEVKRRPGNPHQGILTIGNHHFPCALGRSGTTLFKREGDGATPVGRMMVLYGYYRRDHTAKPASKLIMRQIQKSDGWCDAPRNRNYNRFVSLPYAGSHENLWRKDHLYDLCLVLNWNIRPRMRNAGSAIFFHLAHEDYRPTQGCVAIHYRDMMRILPFIDHKTILKVTL